ncbi:MAG: hypothetical protein WCD72_08925 [Dehalococcoidia bacterium]
MSNNSTSNWQKGLVIVTAFAFLATAFMAGFTYCSVNAIKVQAMATQNLVTVESSKFKYERLRILHSDYADQLAYNRDVRSVRLGDLWRRPEKGPGFDTMYTSYDGLLTTAINLHIDISNALSREEYQLVEDRLPDLGKNLKDLNEAYSDTVEAFYER